MTSLVMAAECADVAGAGDNAAGKLTLDCELDVLRVWRTERRVYWLRLKGVSGAKFGATGSGRDEGELVGVDSGGRRLVEVLIRVSKARICRASVVHCAGRVEAEGWVVEVLKRTLFFGSVVVDAVAAADGELPGLRPRGSRDAGAQAKPNEVRNLCTVVVAPLALLQPGSPG